jgi:hypothetical protein
MGIGRCTVLTAVVTPHWLIASATGLNMLSFAMILSRSSTNMPSISYLGHVNGTIDPTGPYHNPRAPVHIIVGAAGCDEHSDVFNGGPPSNWSAVRLGRSEYGYGKLRVWNASHTTWQQIRAPDGAVRDKVTITKSRRPSYTPFFLV